MILKYTPDKIFRETFLYVKMFELNFFRDMSLGECQVRQV
jgi:hypothetical protein